jgi:hypothetical protein
MIFQSNMVSFNGKLHLCILLLHFESLRYTFRRDLPPAKQLPKQRRGIPEMGMNKMPLEILQK